METMLVKIENGKPVKFVYFKSKFERELGEKVTYNGETLVVGIIGDTKNAVISAANELIKKQNSVVRKQNNIIRKKEKIAEAKFWNETMRKIEKDLKF